MKLLLKPIQNRYKISRFIKKIDQIHNSESIPLSDKIDAIKTETVLDRSSLFNEINLQLEQNETLNNPPDIVGEIFSKATVQELEGLLAQPEKLKAFKTLLINCKYFANESSIPTQNLVPQVLAMFGIDYNQAVQQPQLLNVLKRKLWTHNYMMGPNGGLEKYLKETMKQNNETNTTIFLNNIVKNINGQIKNGNNIFGQPIAKIGDTVYQNEGREFPNIQNCLEAYGFTFNSLSLDPSITSIIPVLYQQGTRTNGNPHFTPLKNVLKDSDFSVPDVLVFSIIPDHLHPTLGLTSTYENGHNRVTINPNVIERSRQTLNKTFGLNIDFQTMLQGVLVNEGTHVALNNTFVAKGDAFFQKFSEFKLSNASTASDFVSEAVHAQQNPYMMFDRLKTTFSNVIYTPSTKKFDYSPASNFTDSYQDFFPRLFKHVNESINLSDIHESLENPTNETLAIAVIKKLTADNKLQSVADKLGTDAKKIIDYAQ